MDTVVFARQPIFDADREVEAYELLFRGAKGATDARFFDGDHATARVIIGAVVDVGLDNVVGTRDAFINCTEALLLGDTLASLPASRVVLEVLEDVRPSRKVLAAMESLASRGYRFALDDFEYRPELQPMLGYADFVKLDVMALGLDGVAEQMKHLEGYRGTIVAEKVETLAEQRRCEELGCHLFQGYFLQKPELVDSTSMAPSKQSILKLVSRVYDPEVDLGELERIISADVGLSYRILRIINSAYFHMPREVTSIRQAVALLGLRFTRMWVSLIAIADLGDAPAEVITGACVRARMCERLAEFSGTKDTDPYYISGLFSMLDAIVQRPLPEVVTALPLTREVHDALLGEPGPIAEALACVRSHEAGQWEGSRFSKLDQSLVQQAYVEALRWARDARQALVMEPRKRSDYD
jgi:EAL and modified HD-GYP domain-containing signal transduction protein